MQNSTQYRKKNDSFMLIWLYQACNFPVVTWNLLRKLTKRGYMPSLPEQGSFENMRF